MKKTLGKLWKFANSPMGEIFNLENLNTVASLAKDSMEAISKFGEILNKMAETFTY